MYCEVPSTALFQAPYRACLQSLFVGEVWKCGIKFVSISVLGREGQDIRREDTNSIEVLKHGTILDEDMESWIATGRFICSIGAIEGGSFRRKGALCLGNRKSSFGRRKDDDGGRAANISFGLHEQQGIHSSILAPISSGTSAGIRAQIILLSLRLVM